MKLNTWEKESNDLSLLDDQFLIALLEQKEREIYARIASLDINEQPIEYIEGKVSDGSINIDGQSAIRRTCNITMAVNDLDINDVYWGIKTKFKLEIGVKNNLTNEYAPTTDSSYPEIVWFPEGTYLITGFNTSIATKGYTISLTGKDKMVMLSGELGGQIFASTDFGKESISEMIFLPVATGALSAEELMKRPLYEKADNYSFPAGVQKYFMSGDEDYKFIPAVDGKWVKFENRYYNLNDLSYTVSNENNVVYKKLVPVLLPGTTFTPVQNKEYVYTPPIPSTITKPFPAMTNADHTKIILQEEQSLIITEHTVEEWITFKSQHYDLYRRIKKPKEMFNIQGYFTNTNISEYEANKFYYERRINSKWSSDESTQEYILGTQKRPKENVLYYTMKTLYTLDNSVTLKKLPLERIIREAVHAYALEPYHNIIVNDLDEYGLEQLTYNGETPMYALRDPDTLDFVQLLVADENTNSNLWDIIKDWPNNSFDSLTSELTGTHGLLAEWNEIRKNAQGEIIFELNKSYYVAKIVKGMDIGYRITDLTYTGDLITNIGDSITSVLDKIKDMLGEFEYFYDLDGHFVFQKKKTYVNTAWSVLTDNGDERYVNFFNEDYKKFSFNFEGNRLVTAFQNSPNLANLKNDFSVWGKRTSVVDKDLPIHARYAIDKKPKEYLAFNGTLYYTEEAENDPSPQWADRIGMASAGSIDINDYHHIDIIPEVLTYTTSNNIKTSDWWELSDWAEYYHALTDVYPSQYLKDYGTEGFLGDLTFVGETRTFKGNGQLVIDFDKNSIPQGKKAPTRPLYTWEHKDSQTGRITATGQWYPFQHAYNGCYHWYDQYLGFYSQYTNMITYIYKPALPNADIIAKDGGRLKIPFDNMLKVDWRELIYRMAIDYFAGQGLILDNSQPIYDFEGRLVLENADHFLAAVAARNPYYYGTGYTGYEQYYTDIQGFWRQLYNPDYIPQPIWEDGSFVAEKVKEQGSSFYMRQKVWKDPNIIGYNMDYYVGGTGLNPKVDEQYEALQEGEIKNKYREYYINMAEDSADRKKRLYWNRNVFEAPETLNFWIEFLDDKNELAEYSVPMVGVRSKVINEDKVGAIYYNEIPGLILCPIRELDAEKNGWKCDTSQLRDQITKENGYKFIYLPKGFAKFFNISYRKLSAKNKIDELLYQFAYCIENVTITALPVYHLEPNTRIYVRDDTTRVNGEYIVNKITLPLKHNGTMSISATKAPERLL